MYNASQRDQVICLIRKLGGDPSIFDCIPQGYMVVIKSNTSGKELAQIDRLDLDDNDSANAIKKIKAIL